MMLRAIALAGGGRHIAHRNPPVGSVVLDAAGGVDGKGDHPGRGTPPAEEDALAAAGVLAPGGPGGGGGRPFPSGDGTWRRTAPASRSPARKPGSTRTISGPRPTWTRSAPRPTSATTPRSRAGSRATRAPSHCALSWTAAG